MENQTPLGFLTVFVTSASTSIPIKNATVLIQREGMEDIVRFTDNSGKTEKIPLSAPLFSNSQEANIPNPFYSYRVSVYKTGFYPQLTQNVPVFPLVSATQSVNLIGLSEYNSGTVIPQENVVTVPGNPQVLDTL
ncbi:MAG: hypothetical protein J6K61_07195 [Clostridia bacterium]|nr:hypothetical protein [Clostridia bacterium]